VPIPDRSLGRENSGRLLADRWHDPVVEYLTSADGVEPRQLTGFFEGWPSPPSPERHLAILLGSSHVVLARDAGEIIGFVTAISDGSLAAYIPLLEVRREWRGKGVGSELVRRLLTQLEDLYMVDVICDHELIPFYERFGMVPLAGLGRRNRSALA
jgi:GNAT superfamily N-acetyltransferase